MFDLFGLMFDLFSAWLWRAAGFVNHCAEHDVWCREGVACPDCQPAPVVLLDPEVAWRLQQEQERGQAEARGVGLCLGMVGAAVAGGLLVELINGRSHGRRAEDRARNIIGLPAMCSKRLGLPGAWPCVLEEGHEREGRPHRERFGCETRLIWNGREYVADEDFDKRVQP